jgi:PAS domain S-box-containing protein
MSGRGVESPPGLVTHSPAQERRHLLALAIIITLLASIYPLVAKSEYMGGADFHATIEAVGGLLGLVAGVALVVRFYTLGNRFHLIMGLAFLVNGGEDLVHGLMSYRNFLGLPASSLAQFIPGTYVTGRMMLGALLFLAPFVPRRFGESKNPKAETKWATSIVLTVTMGLTILAFYTPLPKFIHPDRLISRPVDFISALVLLAALAAFLREYHLKRDTLTWWISLSIGVNAVGQLMMSFSKALYDPFFDIGHVYKVLGYIIPLLGFSLYQIAVITELKVAEEQLQGSHERFMMVLDSLDAGVYVADMDTYEILFVNKYIRDIFGDVVGKTCWKTLQKGQMGPCDFCTNKELVNAKGEPTGVYVWEFQNTVTRHWYELRDRAIRWVDGRIVRLEIATDITERKEMQERLLRQEKLAAVGQLAGSVGHDLRNPLGVISNSAYYLNMRLKEVDEKVKRHLDLLQAEVKRCNQIITDLLDFSRVAPPALENIDVNIVIKGTLTGMEVPENIAVKTHLDPNLPRTHADPGQIQRAFQNLISNAVQAMPEGGTLEIKTGVKDGFVEIAFKDTGEGIPEENLHKVFEPLFSTRAKGVGLGLAIVKGIIDGHEGRIEVESRVRKGTTCTVRLPVKGEEG